MSKIDYLRAGASFEFVSLQSMIREIEINNKQWIKLYCADNEWKVQMGFEEKNTTITWVEFVDIFHDLSKFMANESQSLLAQSDNEGNEDTSAS